MNYYQSEAEKFRQEWENAKGQAAQLRNDLKKQEDRIRSLENEVCLIEFFEKFYSFFCNQKDELLRKTDDLTARLENTRPVNRTKDDDVDRTSRVRAMEKELNSVLDENNVRLFNLSFIFN